MTEDYSAALLISLVRYRMVVLTRMLKRAYGLSSRIYHRLSLNITVNRIFVFVSRVLCQNICCRLCGVYLTFSSFFPDEFNTADVLYVLCGWKYDTFRLTSVHAIVSKWSNDKHRLIRVADSCQDQTNHKVREGYKENRLKNLRSLFDFYNNTRLCYLCIGKFIINGKICKNKWRLWKDVLNS